MIGKENQQNQILFQNSTMKPILCVRKNLKTGLSIYAK